MKKFIEQNIFYANIFIKAYIFSIIVYSYFLVSFIFGNHDWILPYGNFIKDGVKLSSGFYEARFSQHLFSGVLFDGHILPIFTFLLSLGALTLTGIVVARYLMVPKKSIYYLWFALFVALNPYNFVLFYYTYLQVPFGMWFLLGVCCLCLIEKIHTKRQIVMVILFWIVFLGSYPPLISILVVLWLSKRLILFAESDELSIFLSKNRTALIFPFSFIIGFFIFKCIVFFYGSIGIFDTSFYNLQTKPIKDIILSIPNELWQGVAQLFHEWAFIENKYNVSLALLYFIAVICFCLMDKKIKRTKQRVIAIIILNCLILLASRINFLLAANIYTASCRLEYWSRLGIYLMAFTMLFRIETKWLKNFIFILCVFYLHLEIKTDADIAKVWRAGFRAEMNYFERLKERVESKKEQWNNEEYKMVVFGDLKFRSNYYIGNVKNDIYEMLGYHLIFNGATLGRALSEIGMKKINYANITIQQDILFVCDNLDLCQTHFKENYDTENLRLWMYTRAKIWPNIDSIYIDDKYIVLVLEDKPFRSKREDLLRTLKLGE